MNKNNAYAYLLLGAVVLAGIGGFMFADYTPESLVEPTGPTAFSTAFALNISSDNSESVTTGGSIDGQSS